MRFLEIQPTPPPLTISISPEQLVDFKALTPQLPGLKKTVQRMIDQVLGKTENLYDGVLIVTAKYGILDDYRGITHSVQTALKEENPAFLLWGNSSAPLKSRITNIQFVAAHENAAQFLLFTVILSEQDLRRLESL